MPITPAVAAPASDLGERRRGRSASSGSANEAAKKRRARSQAPATDAVSGHRDQRRLQHLNEHGRGWYRRRAGVRVNADSAPRRRRAALDEPQTQRSGREQGTNPQGRRPRPSPGGCRGRARPGRGWPRPATAPAAGSPAGSNSTNTGTPRDHEREREDACTARISGQQRGDHDRRDIGHANARPHAATSQPVAEISSRQATVGPGAPARNQGSTLRNATSEPSPRARPYGRRGPDAGGREDQRMAAAASNRPSPTHAAYPLSRR